MEERSIAIDGPSGAGKSTLSKMAAKHYGMIYVDTGALYRCVGLQALRKGAATKDEAGIKGILTDIDIKMNIDDGGTQRMWLNGEDVTDKIRSPEASMAASDVSALPCVREFLFSTQREAAQKNDVIMDGRDIGTVVLPDARIKVFLTASPDNRAARRYKELIDRGESVLYEDVHRDLVERDRRDMGRQASPLKVAPDAILIDTTDLSLEAGYKKVRDVIFSELQKTCSQESRDM